MLILIEGKRLELIKMIFMRSNNDTHYEDSTL